MAAQNAAACGSALPGGSTDRPFAGRLRRLSLEYRGYRIAVRPRPGGATPWADLFARAGIDQNPIGQPGLSSHLAASVQPHSVMSHRSVRPQRRRDRRESWPASNAGKLSRRARAAVARGSRSRKAPRRIRLVAIRGPRSRTQGRTLTVVPFAKPVRIRPRPARQRCRRMQPWLGLRDST